MFGLRWKEPELKLIQESRLGENFRLLVPRPSYEAAYFNSQDQTVSHIEETSNGVVCTYDSLHRDGSSENNPETIPVQVPHTIRVVDDQILSVAGQVPETLPRAR